MTDERQPCHACGERKPVQFSNGFRNLCSVDCAIQYLVDEGYSESIARQIVDRAAEAP